MEIKIIHFNPEYIDEIGSSFSESFKDWGIDETRGYLMNAYTAFPECCFAAINEKNEILGAVFCITTQYYKGKILLIEAIQIKKEYRKLGAGKALMKKIKEFAEYKKIESIGMLASNKNEFPMSWFKKIGFKETGWIEMATDTDEVFIK